MPVVLAEVRETPLDVAEVLAAVSDPASGAQVVLVGTVRDHDGGRGVLDLGYSAHPGAAAVLREVAERFAARDGVLQVAVVHRVGDLVVGEVAVVAAVATAHRHLALTTCAELVDAVKAELPVWKRQRFLDGSHEWVNAC